MDPSVMVHSPVTQLQRHQNLHQCHTQPTLDLDTPPPRKTSTYKARNTKSKTVFSNLSLDDINHGVEVLEKCFRPVYPTEYVSLKTSDVTSFIHNRHSVGIAASYKNLQLHMAYRAKVIILRDCIVRIRRFESFVRHLKVNVHEEYTLLECLQHQERSPSMNLETKLEYLEGFCDDLRVYLSYWTTIQHKVHSEKWLYPYYSGLISELQTVKDKLLMLEQSAIWWLYELIRVGLCVFAYYKGNEVQQDFLWSITRGIEEYNAILKQALGKGNLQQKNSDKEVFICCTTNAFNAPESIKAISMQNVLGLVALERSKLVAFRTIKFVCENKNVSGILKQEMKPLNWRSYLSTGEVDDTVKKESSSGLNLKCESEISLLSKSDLESLNLSRGMSPLSELEAEEEDFMSQLLSIASFSTAFLHPKFHSQQRVSRGQLHAKRNSTKENNSQPQHRQRRVGRRKSVSWEDSETCGTKKQLCNWYMGKLWKYVGKELHSVLTLARLRMEEDQHLHIGHVFQCGTTHLIVILDMLQALCLKESLPSSAVCSFQLLISRLYNSIAMAASDIELCSALGSSLSDKCLPATLQPGVGSSRTCSFLEASIIPLISVLTANHGLYIINKKQKLPKWKTDASRRDLVDVLLVLQLVTAIDVGNYWCLTKSQRFLSSWSVAEFFLVMQCDHEIITSLCRKALQQVEILSRGTNQSLQNVLSIPLVQLNQLTENFHNVAKLSSQLFSEDCVKLCSEYWQKTMPAGKIWRRKTTNVLPTEPNQYAKDATVTILQPIIEAVSHLQQATQVSIVTILFTTMLNTWMERILKQKSKFSIHGAYQLAADLRYVQHWFGSKTENLFQQMMQRIPTLEAFGHFQCAIELLKQQPHKNDGIAQHLTVSADEINSEYSESTAKSEPCRKSLGSSSDSVRLGAEAADDAEDLEMCVPNSREWLNLRVHGQSKKWILPFTCMKTAQKI